MFDLIAGREKHLPSHATVPLLLSTSAQAAVIALIFVIPLLFVTERLPEVPTMMAFVADVAGARLRHRLPRRLRSRKRAPPKAETAATRTSSSRRSRSPRKSLRCLTMKASEFGVPGGVEGGIPGGVVGGVVGGLPEAPPPPPPPPRRRRGLRFASVDKSSSHN